MAPAGRCGLAVVALTQFDRVAQDRRASRRSRRPRAGRGVRPRRPRAASTRRKARPRCGRVHVGGYRREAGVERPPRLRCANLGLPLSAGQARAPCDQLSIPLGSGHRRVDQRYRRSSADTSRTHRRDGIGHRRHEARRRRDPPSAARGARHVIAHVGHQQPSEALEHERLAGVRCTSGQLAEVPGDVNEQPLYQHAVWRARPQSTMSAADQRSRANSSVSAGAPNSAAMGTSPARAIARAGSRSGLLRSTRYRSPRRQWWCARAGTRPE